MKDMAVEAFRWQLWDFRMLQSPEFKFKKAKHIFAGRFVEVSEETMEKAVEFDFPFTTKVPVISIAILSREENKFIPDRLLWSEFLPKYAEYRPKRLYPLSSLKILILDAKLGIISITLVTEERHVLQLYTYKAEKELLMMLWQSMLSEMSYRNSIDLKKMLILVIRRRTLKQRFEGLLHQDRISDERFLIRREPRKNVFRQIRAYASTLILHWDLGCVLERGLLKAQTEHIY
ncbi:uncharacterized protein LOC142656584 [Rhinoderma darwinii]|uniref:uncharacterized protein LOC142656584 n=1 Tax=Rhinoderma darwinii TaxID=43563 RepID=UPI003F66B5E7